MKIASRMGRFPAAIKGPKNDEEDVHSANR